MMAIENGKTFEDFYPSRWLKAGDLADKHALYTIIDVSAERVGEDQEQKLVLEFQETTKNLVLNKTNGGTLTDLYGGDPNAWITKRVELFTEPVTFRGKVTMAIRILPTIPDRLTENKVDTEPVRPENWQN